MQTVQNAETLQQFKQEEDALLVLFGGRNCNVCHSIKPKLIEQATDRYPNMQMVYVDCHETTGICAQQGIFSLPVVQVFFGGQKFVEEVRSFSLAKLLDDCERPYSLMFSDE